MPKQSSIDQVQRRLDVAADEQAKNVALMPLDDPRRTKDYSNIQPDIRPATEVASEAVGIVMYHLRRTIDQDDARYVGRLCESVQKLLLVGRIDAESAAKAIDAAPHNAPIMDILLRQLSNNSKRPLENYPQ